MRILNRICNGYHRERQEMTRAEKFMKSLKQPKLQPKRRQKVLSMSGSTTTTTPQAKTKESKK
jgi:hypothetical protein